MRKISDADIRIRIARDNPWWEEGVESISELNSPRRVYFEPFVKLALNDKVKRAAILMGPRRVGKTFMLKQLIGEAIGQGFDRKNILYVSIDSPVYSGMRLEGFLSLLPDPNINGNLVIFDEIQYLAEWELHLKDLVDAYPNIKFVASGSAAAALKLKSKESGAGRFSEFMLPPLTFYEFLKFLNEGEKYIKSEDCPNGRGNLIYEIIDIDGLNSRFADYLNYGGYPEAVLNEAIRENPEQFIKNDIIDKVLLKDLPVLYGITKVQELNRLFSYLAYNAGDEANYQTISEHSEVNKTSVKKYLEYLESAFLIIKISSVDDRCKVGARERNFKIYLNNPSMRAALFAPVEKDDSQLMGKLTESAIFSQWQHSPNFRRLKYARWRNQGEVDIVYLRNDGEPVWIGEIKWSDKITSKLKAVTKGITYLMDKHETIEAAFTTTKTIRNNITVDGHEIDVNPSAFYCYVVGRNITRNIDMSRPIID